MILETVIHLLEETKELTYENKKVHKKLQEALDIIHAIKKGDIDAVFTLNNETVKILVSKTADQIYRQFIEAMPQGVVTLLDDGTILYSNLSFSKIVNIPLEKVIGTNLRGYIPYLYIETFERIFDEFPIDNSTFSISIPGLQYADNHYIVSVNKLLLQDFTALNLVWTDITELTQTKENLIIINEKLNIEIKEKIIVKTMAATANKKASSNIKELKDSNIELASFTHLASRILEEPLRKISTYSSLLRSNYYDDKHPEAQRYLAIINRAALQMRDVISDIIEYSDLLNNIILFKSTSLQLIIEQVCVNLEKEIRETKASIVIRKDLPVIEADAGQMIQLFQNILSNSLKFIHPHVSPVIHIAYDVIAGHDMDTSAFEKPTSNYCRILVTDNGIGFKPLYDEKIFHVFQKLNNKLISPGTGIGLAICKKVVSLHHGSIKATSLQKGSLFTIILPVNQIPA